MKIDHCLCCGSDLLETYLDLGEHPLANSYNTGEQLPTYPLRVQFCHICSHSQLTDYVEPEKQFSTYPYVSGTSYTLNDHFRELAEDVKKLVDSRKPTGRRYKILEIAANDGTLLKHIKKVCGDAVEVYGIDPAKNLREYSRNNGLSDEEFEVAFWDSKKAEELKASQGEFDLVIAINVLPHVPNPKDFLKACSEVCEKDGYILVQTSQCDMLKNKEWDCIYSEHISYFTVESMYNLCSDLNLAIVKAGKIPIHSMSFRFVLKKNRPTFYGGHAYEKLEELCKEEKELGLYDINFYRNWGKKVEKHKKDLLDLVNRYLDDSSVIGYGAAAKGSTILNYTGLGLDYIVDDNPMKVGLKMPGSKIPIVSPETLKFATKPLVIILFAWNFEKEILDKIKRITKVPYWIITPFPDPRIKVDLR